MLRTCALAAGFAAAMLVSPMAHAADDKTMPGSECVPSTGNNPDGTRFFLVDSTFFYADSGAPLRADCPILKERVGRGITNVSVFVVDNNPSADIACQLISQQVTPNAPIVQRQGQNVSSTGASRVTRQLNLGGLPAAAGIGSYWFVSCNLPPSTGIRSYYVNEQQ